MAGLESSFLNIGRGSRQTGYMGLVMAEGAPVRFGGKDYSYAEIPLVGFRGVDKDKPEDVGQKAIRNQHVYVVPACTINVRGDFHIQVEPNPALSEFGSVQGSYYVHNGSGILIPGFWMTLRKDLEAADVQYAIRLYMRA